MRRVRRLLIPELRPGLWCRREAPPRSAAATSALNRTFDWTGSIRSASGTVLINWKHGHGPQVEGDLGTALEAIERHIAAIERDREHGATYLTTQAVRTLGDAAGTIENGPGWVEPPHQYRRPIGGGKAGDGWREECD